jgi:hypothetical protein
MPNSKANCISFVLMVENQVLLQNRREQMFLFKKRFKTQKKSDRSY